MIIGIAGKKRVGKTTVGQIMARKCGMIGLHAFADELKKDVANHLGIGVDELEGRKDEFRLLLQEYGTKMRVTRGNDYWITRLKVGMATCQYPIKVITDVRFKNESDWIYANGGVVVLVERELERDNHESEALHGVRWSHLILNESGFSDLVDEVTTTLNSILQTQGMVGDREGRMPLPQFQTTT